MYEGKYRGEVKDVILFLEEILHEKVIYYNGNFNYFRWPFL